MPRSPLHQATPELIRDALSAIPPDVDRDTWVKLAMAIKAELPNDEAFALWDEWSRGGTTYQERAARDTWRSVKAGGRVKIGSLFAEAKRHGWRFPEKAEKPTAAQLAERQVRAAQVASERQRQLEEEDAERARQEEESARRCLASWEKASTKPPARATTYCERKGVKPHGLRFIGNVALVPMRDVNGRLWSLQRLMPQRMRDAKSGKVSTDKLYGPIKAKGEPAIHSRKSGLMHLIGGPLDGSALLLLAEGYATGATLHEATGLPVAVCFDAGNLVHIARELRARWPALPFLVCGDDDRHEEAKGRPNAGKVKAQAAAVAGGAALGLALAVLPEHASDDGKDFNDVGTAIGLEAVAEQVNRAAAELAQLREQAGRHAGDAPPATQPPDPPVDCAEPEEPGSHGADPAARPGGTRDPFFVDESGVWHVAKDREGNERRPVWVSDPLHVLALSRLEDGNGWGYLLRFSDQDGGIKTWAMPSAMLKGDGAVWAGRLADMGLRTAHGTTARNLLGQYIESRRPDARVTCVDRVGWHDSTYVLPSGSIDARPGLRYVFQSEAGMEDTFHQAGELADWRDLVAGRARGNSRFVFALCVALAGPLLRPMGIESGGFHLCDDSSRGKTSTLLLAASVWGRPSFMQRWRATSNALEGVAVQHCDCTLILDEFGQMDPREAGEVAYLLGNETEKSRSTRSGLNRKRRTWRLLFLSSGEISLADHIAEGGRRLRAGMQVRMVDVPLDAGAGMGAVEDRHGHESAAGFVEQLRADASVCFGTAGRAWLEYLCRQHDRFPARLRTLLDRFRDQVVPEAAGEQVRRVGTRFALVAAAGEMAGEASITGWPEGHAFWAVRRCFNAWLAARGHIENAEPVAMVRHVRAWLEKNGDSLFTWLQRAPDDRRPATPLRAGYKRLVDDEGKPIRIDAASDHMESFSRPGTSERDEAVVEFLIFPEAFRIDVCRGLGDHEAVARELRDRGLLRHEKDRLTVKHRIPGVAKKAPFYHVKSTIFELDD